MLWILLINTLVRPKRSSRLFSKPFKPDSIPFPFPLAKYLLLD
jgi:hypothetical protein